MKPLHHHLSTRLRRLASGATLAILTTTSLAVLGGCLIDEDDRGTTDETNTARIVGPGGSSAPGAEILVFKMGDTTQTPIYVTYADEDGRYSLRNLPDGRYNLVASSGSFALYRDSVALGPNARRVDTLARPGSLSGRIELEAGDNPKAVTVQALGTELWSNVDSLGTFHFPKIPGGEYTLRASTNLRDYTPTFARVETVDDSAIVMEKPIRLVYAGKEPRIFLPDGTPAAGAVVSLSPFDQSYAIEARRMVTDASGRYSLAGLEAARYHMLVKHGDLALLRDTIWLAPGVVRKDTLRRTGSLRGRVEFAVHGSSTGLAVVTLVGTGLGCVTDMTGAFEFPSLPSGRYTLRLAPNRIFYDTTEIGIEVLADSAVVLPDPIRPRYFGPPPITGLQAAYDTLAGVVRLSWHGVSAAAEYHVFRDPIGAAGNESYLHRVVTDTTFVDTIFHIGGLPPSGSESVLPASGGVYRVCTPWPDEAVGGCSTLEVHPISPYERRQSGMRWTRLGTNPISGEFAPVAQIRVLRDSLLVIGTGPRFSAWKSADGATWANAFDSLPKGSWGLPVSWNDSLWILVRSGDTLELRSSRDGSSWIPASLPVRVLPDSGMGIPSLLPTSEGLVVCPMYGAFASLIRDVQGIWRPTPTPITLVDYGLGGVIYLSTYSSLWGVVFQYAGGNSIWRQNPLGSATPKRSMPLNAGGSQAAELQGILYVPESRGEFPTRVFATPASPEGSWWYIDFPGGTCVQLTSWKSHLVAVGSDGGVWLGEPTAAP